MRRTIPYLLGVAAKAVANGDLVRLQVVSVGREFSVVKRKFVRSPESVQNCRVGEADSSLPHELGTCPRVGATASTQKKTHGDAALIHISQ